MKTFLGSVMLFFVFSSIAIVGIPQEIDWTDIPGTSSSPQALELYKTGSIAMFDVNMNKANDCFKKASELEPNFIMPNVSLAYYYFYLKDMAKFKEFANKVLASTYNLNESEILIQKAMKILLDNPTANVTEYGEKLVKLNPKSVFAYQMLATYQGFAKDYDGQIKTYQAMLQLTKDQAPIYNSLGYCYMELNKIDEAWNSFEKYIAAAPKNPNAYDSMGDYYVKVQDYKKAHLYFTKAYRMDTVNFKFSLEKADKLKPQLGY